MKKVLILDKLGSLGVEYLQRFEGLDVVIRTGLAPDELARAVADCHAIIVRSQTRLTEQVIRAAVSLQVIGRAGVGVDNIDVGAATRQGVVVMNTPDSNAATTAELTWALLLALARKIPQAVRSLKEGGWERSSFLGTELQGKVLGIIGLGHIGKLVAQRASGFEMTCLGHDPYISPESLGGLEVEMTDLDQLFARSDFISVHTPLNEHTRNLIDREAFLRMKKGVRILNCARGGIVNEEDLEWAIREGIVAGAAVDVFSREPPGDHPLLGLDQVIATPHLGASTHEAQEKVSLAIASQVADYLLHDVVRNAVNFPSVSPQLLSRLRPHITLGEKLGSLLGQLVRGSIDRVHVEYAGEVASEETAPLTGATLRALLSPQLEERVNDVNARHLAAERGIKVVESVTQEVEDFLTLVTVTVDSAVRRSRVAGTLLGRSQPRIVRIDDFELDAIPEGPILVTRNYDRPGVIGAIGTELGRNGINISRLQLGLKEPGGVALALINVESTVPATILEVIRGLDHIISVDQVVL